MKNMINNGFPAPTATPNPCTPVTNYIVPTILFCGSLTSAEKTSINNTVNAFKTENCASNYLYNYFNKSTFSFCIKAGNYNVIYNPANQSFTFSNEAIATPAFSSLLEHEFFHAYQNALYPNGISSYGLNQTTGIASPGFVNIEFEQAVFNDIVSNNYDTFTNGSPVQKNAYSSWIKGIRGNGTGYTKLTPGTPAYTQFVNQFNTFLSQYNSIPGNPYTSAVINLDPKALVNFLNNSNPNCGL